MASPSWTDEASKVGTREGFCDFVEDLVDEIEVTGGVDGKAALDGFLGRLAEAVAHPNTLGQVRGDKVESPTWAYFARLFADAMG